MQDSTVTITITAVDGATKVFQGVGDTAVKQANRAAAAWQKNNAVQNVSIESTGKLGKAAGAAAGQQDRLAASTRRSYLAQTALTTVLSASINKAFLELVDVTGQAIQRVDLIANFPKSMAALGLSAKDASVSLRTLSNYIGSIGGNLQDATVSVARFAEVTKNVKAATAEFVGVNNALIAGGAGQEVQKNALEQLTQAYSRGIPQLIEWRSLMVAMPAQLSQVAHAMKLPNAQALGEALTHGKVSMQSFITELTKLSTGTGPIAQQALARMSGIQFAFNVFKNTMVQGITTIIQTIGRQNIVNFFTTLTGVVQQLAIWAVKLISILFSLFNIISRIFGGPQLKLARDETAGVADNLGAGAANADDLSDGLDDATKAAKKTAKQLASFDKMNVLTEPSDSSGSGKDKKPSAAGAPLSDADAAALEDIFDKIGGKIGKISAASKILAGILAGIAAIKFAQGLLNQFNGIIKTVKETGDQLNSLKKKLFGTEDKKGVFAKAKDSVKSFLDTLGTVGGFIAGVFSNSKAVQAAGKFGKFLFAPILAGFGVVVGALETLVLGVAVALGVSIGAAIAIIAAAVVAIGVIIFLVVKYWDTIWASIKLAAQVFWDFIVAGWQLAVDAITAVWNTLFDIFAGPVKFIVQFIEAMMTLSIAIVAIALEAIAGLFVLLVKGVFAILSTVATWIFNNVISPVVKFFVDMWKKIVDLAKASWDFVFEKILRPVVGWVSINVTTPVFNLFRGLWDGVVGLVRGFWTAVMNVLRPFAGWVKANVIDPVLGFFNSLWDKIKNGLSAMMKGLGSILGNLANIVKAPINGVIDLLNRFFGSLGSIKVPDWVPNVGGNRVEFPRIPKLASGGIVQQSMIANVGENGSEAIIPLENNMQWLDKLANKINSTTGGGQPIQLVVQIGEDKIATKVIDLINEKTQMSGRNSIFV